ncbi:hypothetical protein NX059_011307 [Plenodomus lindquistii]|nr:hypothetical protein NX059_011307 [Plenodomus lindquistii]
MANTPKHVLIAGLGRFVPADYEAGAKLGVQKSNKQMVLDDIEKAQAAGYSCSSMDVNPDKPEDSLRQLKNLLQERHCDLFIVGMGLRSNPVCYVVEFS